MARRNRPGLAFHDLQVHQDFTGVFLRAGKLVSFEIHQAHILGFHEPFAHKGGRTERDVFAHKATLLTVAFGYPVVDMPGHVHDYGTKFLVTAGLLNVLAMVDAFEIAAGRKD